MIVNFSKMTQSEMIAYWRSCLNDWDKSSDIEIASRMVAVGASDYFHDSQYEEDGKTQNDFSKLFELALDLESDYPPGDSARDYAWQEVRRLLDKLEKKHLQQGQS